MYNEPSAYEYGKAVNRANKNASTRNFTCIHNNCGWCGWWITTPNGNKYCLVKTSTSFADHTYHICEYRRNGSHGRTLVDMPFKSLEQCKDYMMKHRM